MGVATHSPTSRGGACCRPTARALIPPPTYRPLRRDDSRMAPTERERTHKPGAGARPAPTILDSGFRPGQSHYKSSSDCPRTGSKESSHPELAEGSKLLARSRGLGPNAWLAGTDSDASTKFILSSVQGLSMTFFKTRLPWLPSQVYRMYGLSSCHSGFRRSPDSPEANNQKRRHKKFGSWIH